jgi:hypothetical protein
MLSMLLIYLFNAGKTIFKKFIRQKIENIRIIIDGFCFCFLGF